MKKFLLILIIISYSAIYGYAQYNRNTNKYVDFGFFIGGSYYIGDLNNKQFKFTQPAGGVVCRYNFNKRLAVRGNLLIGNIEGFDAYSSSQWQQQRNLSFKSPVRELSVQLEFNFLEYKIGGNAEQSFSPYLFLGVAGFHFNPQAEVDGNWINLQPLGTEGQGLPGGPKPYSLTQVSVPFGLGFKTNFSKGMSIGFEWGMRKTFTGYLDDVSGQYYNPTILAKDHGALSALIADRSIGTDPNSNTGQERGNGKDDWYSFFGIVLTIKINKHESCAGALKMGGEGGSRKFKNGNLKGGPGPE